MTKPVLLSIALLFSACSSTPDIEQTKILNDVKLAPKAERLTDATKRIDAVTVKPEVKIETAKINIVASELVEDGKTVDEYKSRLLALEKQLQEAKSESEKKTQAIWVMGMWVGGIMLIGGIIVSVISIKFPSLFGVGIGFSGCGITINAVSYTMMTQAWIGIAIGITALIAIIGIGVFFAVRSHKDSVNHKTANLDLIRSIELIKNELPNWGQVRKKVSQLQNPETQAIIKNLKHTKLNNKI